VSAVVDARSVSRTNVTCIIMNRLRSMRILAILGRLFHVNELAFITVLSVSTGFAFAILFGSAREEYLFYAGIAQWIPFCYLLFLCKEAAFRVADKVKLTAAATIGRWLRYPTHAAYITACSMVAISIPSEIDFESAVAARIAASSTFILFVLCCGNWISVLSSSVK